jgi:hypothetical protein
MRRFAATIRLVFERLRLRPGFWAGVLLALLVAVALLAGAVGAAPVPIMQVPRAIFDPAHPAHAVLVQIRLPRLADRREDLPLLVQHFLERFSKQYGKPVQVKTSE